MYFLLKHYKVGYLVNQLFYFNKNIYVTFLLKYFFRKGKQNDFVCFDFMNLPITKWPTKSFSV